MSSIRVQLSKGAIHVNMKRHFTEYTFDSEEGSISCHSLEKVLKFIFPNAVHNHVDQKSSDEARLDVLKAERAHYRSLWVSATQPRTLDEVFIELEEKGVECTNISIQCQSEDCDEVCGTEEGDNKPISEVAASAAALCDFHEESFFCGCCQSREDQQAHLENQAELQDQRRRECA